MLRCCRLTLHSPQHLTQQVPVSVPRCRLEALLNLLGHEHLEERGQAGIGLQGRRYKHIHDGTRDSNNKAPRRQKYQFNSQDLPVSQSSVSEEQTEDGKRKSGEIFFRTCELRTANCELQNCELRTFLKIKILKKNAPRNLKPSGSFF